MKRRRAHRSCGGRLGPSRQVTNHLVKAILAGMASFNIYEAKMRLSKLIRLVRAGQEVIIADAGTPVARLVPIEPPRTERTLGADRGKLWVAPDAFAPLTGDDLAAWNGPLFPDSPRRPPRPPPIAQRAAARRPVPRRRPRPGAGR
jgi:prevent-host-death family protein